MAGTTLFDKIWESHVVREEPDGGQVFFDGSEVTGQSPRAITRRGVGRWHQAAKKSSMAAPNSAGSSK